MCTAAAGGQRAGARFRSVAGKAAQRAGATKSIKSVFQAGDYKVRNTRRYESGKESGRTYDSDWSHVRINTAAEKQALLSRQLNIRARGIKNSNIDYDNDKFDRKFSVRRWQEASFKGNSTAAIRANDIKRKGKSPEFKNEVTRDKQGRVGVRDERQTLKAARKVRGASVRETGYRSRRKGAAQATNGLRIGGSGVNVPGGGGVQ